MVNESQSTGLAVFEGTLVECGRCGFANPSNLSFCGSCGAPLTLICATCRTPNPPRFRFCGGCGASLARGAAARPARQTDRAAAIREAERHQLTVMFCDLVGSTALSLKLDPEELRELLRTYQAVCAEAIERFGGYIAQYLGDGVLVYFGYPVALENEAERAVRAGLRLVREIERINAHWRQRAGDDVAVRIGIHTGLVVVDEVGGGARRENLALGGTPNIAARLQSLAEPNTIVISAVTQRLIARHFQCEDLGPASLRGVTGIGTTWRVVGERIRTRGSHRSRLVGRDAELGTLIERWRHVTDGEGQAVLVGGDAGIGKSHLIDDFLDRIRATTYVVLECRCQAYYQCTALYPIVDFLEREIGFASGQDDHHRLGLLRSLLERDGLPVDEMLPLFATLLELPFTATPDAPAQTPGGRRERTRNALLRMILKAADTSPVIFLMEDLHWADPSTLDLIERLIPQLRQARILALFTTRPGFVPPWRHEEHAAVIDLGRLGFTHAEQIVRGIAGKPLPDDVLRQIVSRTDGVPLFVEELSKMVLQSELLEEREDRYVLNGPLPPLAIPTTLKDSLEARLDRLAAVKEIAQLGATLGREFGWELLSAVAQIDDGVLADALDRLTRAELIWADGAPPMSTYTFKHALIQEAAYESLLLSTRQRYHRRIATVLEREFPGITETEPETIAHHYTGAGLPDRAIGYWLKAGQRALHASANLESEMHLQRGIELLPLLPEGDTRNWLEIDFQAALGTVLIASEGYTSPRVCRAYERARTVCQALNDTGRIAPVLAGLFAYYIVRRELIEATELAVELSALADATEDKQTELLASVANGVLELNRGQLANARAALERSLDLYDPDRHASLTRSFGHDLGVLCHAYLAGCGLQQGRIEQARTHGRLGVELGRRVRHAHSLALSLAFQSAIQLDTGDLDAAAHTAEELLGLATEWQFKHWQGDALLTQACVLAANGRIAAALERTQEADALFRDRGTGADPQYDLRLARVYAAAGRLDDAITVIEDNIVDVRDPGATRWNVEFCLALGTLLLEHADRAGEAEAWLRSTIDQARQSGAHWPMLRACTLLARILAGRGRPAEAVELLAPACAAFDNGFELADVRAAAELLESLQLEGAIPESEAT